MRAGVIAAIVLAWVLVTASNSILSPPDALAHDCPGSGAFDTDGDGLVDSTECFVGTDHHDPDTDDDTLGDGDEVIVYGTNPTAADSDGDGRGGVCAPVGVGGIAEIPAFTGASPEDASAPAARSGWSAATYTGPGWRLGSGSIAHHGGCLARQEAVGQVESWDCSGGPL